MPEYQVTLKEYYDITPPGQDAVWMAFTFEYVAKEKIGRPDEQASITQGIIEVKITRSRWHSGTWRNLSRADLGKVMYWYAREKVPRLIEQGAECDAIYLDTRSAPNNCPYDPARIDFPPGIPFGVEVRRKMGF